MAVKDFVGTLQHALGTTEICGWHTCLTKLRETLGPTLHYGTTSTMCLMQDSNVV